MSEPALRVQSQSGLGRGIGVAACLRGMLGAGCVRRHVAQIRCWPWIIEDAAGVRAA
jgi:hypothetical protein